MQCYPATLKTELLKNVGDFYIDCERMPAAMDLKGHETEVIDAWLRQSPVIRDQQTQLFDYLLTIIQRNLHGWRSLVKTAPALALSHAPYTAGYNPKINSVRPTLFPNQYHSL